MNRLDTRTTEEPQVAAVRAAVAAVEDRAERFDVATPAGPVVWRRWGRGKPLVLVHGGAGSWSHWLRIIPTLAHERAIYAPDLPGFGASVLSPMPQRAEEIAALIETSFAQLPGAPASVGIGAFSFGGVVAGLWAKACPSRVRSLQIFGAVGLGVERAALPEFARVDRSLPAIERWEQHRANLALMMLANAADAPDLALHLQDENTRATRLRSRPISLLNLLAETLPTLSCPVRLVWGGTDALYPTDRTERIAFARRVPHGEAAFVEDAGHWVMFDAPDAVARLLVDEPRRPDGETAASKSFG